MDKQQRLYNKLYSLILSAFTTLAVVLLSAPVWAQSTSLTAPTTPAPVGQVQAGELLQEAITEANQSVEAMDRLWVDLFAPDSMLYNRIVFITTALLVIGFFFFMLSFARAMQNNDRDKIMEIVFWGCLLSVLLANNGAALKSATLASRDFINDQAQSVLLIQIGDVTIQDAERDIILDESARARIKSAFVGCEAKEGDEQLTCLEEGIAEANQVIREYESQRFGGAALQRLQGNINQIDQLVQEASRAGEFGNGIGGAVRTTFEYGKDVASLLWQSSSNSASRTLLKSFQGWFTYGYEFAMILTGLLGPIAVAASLLPQQPRAIVSWIIAFFSLGMLKLSYNLLVGFAAVYATYTNLDTLSSNGFLLMLSIGAPLISVAIAGGGGASIFFALGKTTALVATVIPAAGTAGGLVRR